MAEAVASCLTWLHRSTNQITPFFLLLVGFFDLFSAFPFPFSLLEVELVGLFSNSDQFRDGEWRLLVSQAELMKVACKYLLRLGGQ